MPLTRCPERGNIISIHGVTNLTYLEENFHKLNPFSFTGHHHNRASRSLKEMLVHATGGIQVVIQPKNPSPL